jgi:RNA polymerase sigma factor (sigma-70 family)
VEELRIIKRSIKGVKSAQRELYEQYRQTWYVICLRYAACDQDAHDMLQNALVKIYSNLKSYDSNKGSFKAWSSAIVVNECLMFLRKSKGIMMMREEYVQNVILTAPSTAVHKMAAEEIMTMVRALPDGYRAVFNLYGIEGYSHKEIAELLGISVGTSKSQLHKARKMLQDMISEIFEVVSP